LLTFVFSFGKFFGNKDRAKSPAATDKTPVSEPSKVDAVPPKIEDPVAPAAPTPVEPVVVAPVVGSKPDPVSVPAQDKENVAPAKETPKKEKRGSIFGSLGRSLSKATKSTPKEQKKEPATPTTVTEAPEPKDESVASPLAAEKKDESPAVAAPAEKSIGDVVPEAVTVGEAPKSTPAVSTTV